MTNKLKDLEDLIDLMTRKGVLHLGPHGDFPEIHLSPSWVARLAAQVQGPTAQALAQQAPTLPQDQLSSELVKRNATITRSSEKESLDIDFPDEELSPQQAIRARHNK